MHSGTRGQHVCRGGSVSNSRRHLLREFLKVSERYRGPAFQNLGVRYIFGAQDEAKFNHTLFDLGSYLCPVLRDVHSWSLPRSWRGLCAVCNSSSQSASWATVGLPCFRTSFGSACLLCNSRTCDLYCRRECLLLCSVSAKTYSCAAPRAGSSWRTSKPCRATLTMVTRSRP
jgi:hypothetical protein